METAPRTFLRIFSAVSTKSGYERSFNQHRGEVVMLPFSEAQILRIVFAAKTPAQFAAVSTLIAQYGWSSKGVSEALAYAKLNLEDLPVEEMPVASVLSPEQQVLIVESATSRDEVAAVIGLVVEKHWIESGVLDALRASVLKVQDLPPTPKRFQRGPADDMASEVMECVIAKAVNEIRKDELQLALAEIARNSSNPLHPLFVPY